MITALVGLLFPVLSTAYLLIPRSSVGRIMRQPFIKFICHSVSYIFFLSMYLEKKTTTFFFFIGFFFVLLVLLFVVSLRIDFGELLSDAKVSNERRGPPPNPVELAVRFKSSFFFLY
jgi:hypothetical protein